MHTSETILAAVFPAAKVIRVDQTITKATVSEISLEQMKQIVAHEPFLADVRVRRSGLGLTVIVASK
jgi:hypothetical protein